jgi:hypothetical protein
MKKMMVAVALSAAALSACQGAPSKAFDVNSADFSTAKVVDLCTALGMRMNRSNDARQELARRGTFSEYEWSLIDAQRVAPGLSECGVKAAWRIDAVAKYNFLKDPHGKLVETDMIYACGKAPAPYCPYTMVQIHDGRVTSVVQLSKL